ncbi:MAG: hypothetical protein HYR66_04195 [Sphingobacteriales bacterium]|nr:hypothetical protein [Sphingobacteriales bacterium]MBI3717966.1 hypothetical protein [Sphingobacteriales bacterium]
METRIILTVLCFTMSLLSLIRGLYLIRLEQKQGTGATINLHDAADTLKLVFFNGIKSRNGIVLLWKSNTQMSRWGFSIEKKNDKGEFVEIAHFYSAANGQYRFIDSNTINYETEYRLKQIDPFGGIYYSKKVLTSRC